MRKIYAYPFVCLFLPAIVLSSCSGPDAVEGIPDIEGNAVETTVRTGTTGSEYDHYAHTAFVYKNGTLAETRTSATSTFPAGTFMLKAGATYQLKMVAVETMDNMTFDASSDVWKITDLNGAVPCLLCGTSASVSPAAGMPALGIEMTKAVTKLSVRLTDAPVTVTGIDVVVKNMYDQYAADGSYRQSVPTVSKKIALVKNRVTATTFEVSDIVVMPVVPDGGKLSLSYIITYDGGTTKTIDSTPDGVILANKPCNLEVSTSPAATKSMPGDDIVYDVIDL